MEEVLKYFNAERNESILFIAAGLISTAVSFYFLLKLKQPILNGAAYPLIGIALIQLTVGGSVFLRSPKDIVRVNEIIQTDTSKIQSEEIPRMETVMKNFILYRWIEIALILTGAFMFFYFPQNTAFKGAGLGLFIQAALMLILDFFAESRGNNYLEFLKSLNHNP
ncbi:MAG: hypothetical protein JSS91_07155 [Bacteroidetes bacterium]|nr:hypothetical protein [Bacteroidota bacterium]